jgi:hypothetical protein
MRQDKECLKVSVVALLLVACGAWVARWAWHPLNAIRAAQFREVAHSVTTAPPRKSMVSPEILKGCSTVYLDVGTNIGVQIRKLHEPEKYPDNPMGAHFKKWFGNHPHDEVCTVGFEPNPAHKERLDFLEKCYTTKKGWRTVVLRAAVWAGEENATVAFKSAKNDSIADDFRFGGEDGVNVTALNFAAFVRDVVLAEPRKEVAAKFDVAGAEYTVLADLLEKGLTGVFDVATVEWHATENQAEAWSLYTVLSIMAPQFFGLDDESYNTDGKPWPHECLH